MERATHDLGKNIKVEGKIFSKCILKTVRHTLVTTGKRSLLLVTKGKRKGVHVLIFL